MQKTIKKYGLLCGALLCAAGLVIWGTNFYKKQTCKETVCLLLDKIKGYQQVDVYQDTERSYGAFFKKGNNQLKIDVWLHTEQPEAESIIKSHTIRMYTLYENAVSPYPGEISNAISCAQEYRPTYTIKQAGARETHFFTGYANDRLAFGACADDLIANRAAVAMFYCGEQKRLYKLELFFPISGTVEKFNEEAGRIRAMPCE